MAEERAFGPPPAARVPSPGRPAAPTRTPSGLFPAGPPTRPTYREPHPVRRGAVAAGGGAAAAWMLFLGLLGGDLTGYAWWTLLAGTAAWLAAAVLTWAGDRGVAAGIALVTAVAWAIAATTVAVRWAESGDWPLW